MGLWGLPRGLFGLGLRLLGLPGRFAGGEAGFLGELLVVLEAGRPRSTRPCLQRRQASSGTRGSAELICSHGED